MISGGCAAKLLCLVVDSFCLVPQKHIVRGSKITVQCMFCSSLTSHHMTQVEWSTADPWLFASLSYDGRFILNHVPRETKFAILL